MRTSRKMEHIRLTLEQEPEGSNGLQDILPIPAGLPEMALASVSLATQFGELTLSSPIVVNAMTGGAEETVAINRSLAEAAAASGMAMAVGSQMAALKDPAVEESYRVVRRIHQNGILFANLGTEATVEQAKRAVDMLEANALQLHLNAMQELVMPEGDRDFSGACRRIEAIVKDVGVPVVVKEVGFGMSRETARRLINLGVRMVDVGGRGGTDFAAIENARRPVPLDWLNGWGLKTSVSLLETVPCFPAGHVMASGGLRTSLDIVTALLLGASAAGMAGNLLFIVQQEGTEGLIAFLRRVEEGIRLLMTALGARSIPELWQVPAVISGETAHWCRERDVNTRTFAERAR
ncbi:type 2 isopentenyl-diphosphate Delta-isomerase [Gorillibacterium timonense]|uniref:type 2 isopentenyl-diphosphate Delta-isomerase n=1 Tax=Gorillibacterium timonense TaxID=1689269 RepID=UPI00071E4F8A|nr:type 2 isopentenyl-diphosphate Delta-isomerase [Gorillibacterium timonense]